MAKEKPISLKPLKFDEALKALLGSTAIQSHRSRGGIDHRCDLCGVGSVEVAMSEKTAVLIMQILVVIMLCNLVFAIYVAYLYWARFGG